MDSTSAIEANALPPFRCAVQPEWLDYNGHVRDAYYGLIFSLATDAFMDRIGLDAEGRARYGSTLYTLESHVSYLQELHGGAHLEVQAQLIAHDAKRLHLYLVLHAAGVEGPAAVGEQMLLHIDTSGPRAARMPVPVLNAVERIAQAHERLPVPMYVGRSIGLHRNSRPMPL